MHIPQDRTVYHVYQTTFDMLKKIANQNPFFDVKTFHFVKT